jgi:hypothetical protein
MICQQSHVTFERNSSSFKEREALPLDLYDVLKSSFTKTRVADPHHFTVMRIRIRLCTLMRIRIQLLFHFNADPDPIPHQRYGNLPKFQFELPGLHCKRQRLYFDLNANPHPVFHFNADPDPAFHSNANPSPAFHSNSDPDPASKNNADPDPQP